MKKLLIKNFQFITLFFLTALLSLSATSANAADGDMDSRFCDGCYAQANDEVLTISTQSDGKIIIGGYFTSYNLTTRNRIARLNTDGTLDTSFNPSTGANTSVFTTAVQSDGKIIIGGWFTSYNGTNRNYIARLNTSGTLDTSFNPVF